mgnify:FL=1
MPFIINNLTPPDHFPVTLLVVGVVGAHPAVPEVEVEAKVPFEAVVVLDVVRRGAEEFAEPGIHEPLGVEFVAGVASDGDGDLQEPEQAEGERVNGQGERHEWDDAGLDDGLAWADAISGPRAGVMALVVDAMEEAEELGVMDEPMRPIEIRVVHEDCHRDAAPEPAPPKIINV